jgi:hypothetical protein
MLVDPATGCCVLDRLLLGCSEASMDATSMAISLACLDRAYSCLSMRMKVPCTLCPLQFRLIFDLDADNARLQQGVQPVALSQAA